MRILPNFKVPKFKMEKIKMENIDEEKLKKESVQNKKVEYTPTNYKTIKEVFERSRIKYANNIFMLEKFNPKESFKSITYKEFAEDVIALNTALMNKYNLKGKRVIIIGENTYHWYVSYMALLCADAIAVPTDKELPVNELENVIRKSRASAVIYTAKQAEKVKKLTDISTVEYFIQMYDDGELNNKFIGLNTVIRDGKALRENGDKVYEETQIDPEEFKVLIFTSGTTSNAKGVMISHKNLASNINAISAYVKLYEEDRLFSVLPLHHTYESTIGFLTPFASGCSIAICEGLKHISDNLKETKPTIMLAVPLLIESLYSRINKTIAKSKKTKVVNTMISLTNMLCNVGINVKRKVFHEILDNLGGNIRIIVSAAAPIDPKAGKWIKDIGITFLQGYGLTETAPIAALTPEFEEKMGSAGKAVKCAELKIDSPKENGMGEVLIKSDTLMIGYYEDEGETRKVIEVDEQGNRWFHSGDMGYLDKDGYLFITGRSKNVIVTQNGKNIYPEEIELLLNKVPVIQECMVYGKEVPGEKELIITAKVIPNMTEIKALCEGEVDDKFVYDTVWKEIKNINKQLTSYKSVKKLEIKTDDFEKTSTMKIKRYAEVKKDNNNE